MAFIILNLNIFPLFLHLHLLSHYLQTFPHTVCRYEDKNPFFLDSSFYKTFQELKYFFTTLSSFLSSLSFSIQDLEQKFIFFLIFFIFWINSLQVLIILPIFTFLSLSNGIYVKDIVFLKWSKPICWCFNLFLHFRINVPKKLPQNSSFSWMRSMPKKFLKRSKWKIMILNLS